jgi:hypothetical protein
MTVCTQGNVIGITLYHHSCDGKFRGHGHTDTIIIIIITAADPHIIGSQLRWYIDGRAINIIVAYIL